MAIGPFDSFAFPGVYTRTLTEAPRATASGELRVPAFIGVAADTIPVSNYEMIRGSSSMADNPIVKENVSSQFTGTERLITVTKKPIVKGDGTGTVTNDPKTVQVLINGNPVPVASVNGAGGLIYLVNIPALGDEVLVSYFYKQTDTLHTEEDLSDQVDGTVRTFQTHNYPIVSGDNSGITTTDVSKIVVKVNNVIKVPTLLDGENGQFTLSVADTPSSGATLSVTYYTNDLQNTADILPSPYVDSITSVGYAPGSSDFVQGTDYVLDTTGIFSTIQWGNSCKVANGQTTPGFTSLATDTTCALYDNLVWRRPVLETADGTRKTFTLEAVPTDGQSRGKITEDPSKISAFVGANPAGAADATVLTLNPLTRVFSLNAAPAAGQKVYATQYTNLLRTDSWTIDCTSDSTYLISGANSGVAMNVTFYDASVFDNADFSTENVTYPAGSAGGGFQYRRDTQVLPGVAIEETVKLLFSDATTYTVSSNQPNGTGSSGDNTGHLNQTYIDNMTGFRVTVCTGTLVTYTATDYIRYKVSKSIAVDPNPVLAIPGSKITVGSTSGVNPGDTAIVNTYRLVGAAEPSVGDFYYVTFEETKQFDSNGLTKAKFYTQEKDVLIDTGDLTIDNKIGLAAHYAFLNGAAAVVLLQIKKATSGPNAGIDAPDSEYIAAINYFNEPMEGGLRPTLMQPVTTSNAVIQYLKQSNAIQSGQRYGNEHRSYIGFPLNTTPTVAQTYARGLNNERMTAVYPDGAVMVITDALGNQTEYLVDGSLMASAMAGRDVSPAFDVAEPMTGKPINGFTRLYRRLDSVTSAQTANSGITLFEESAGGIQIKFALTTDTSSVLTRTPSIVRTKDFIQRGSRSILTPYIGTKMLVQRLTEIEDTLNSYLASLQQAQIITAFQPVKATQDPADPSIVNVEAFYSPVPELLWIMITFNLRSAV